MRSQYWQAPDPYGSPVSGGRLRVNFEYRIDSFDVWTDLRPATILMRSATHEQLVRWSPYNGTEIIPGLAEGWTIADDDTSIIFFFEDGIAWHNGDPFICQDALFSLETMANGAESSLASNFSFVDSLECVDAADRSTQALKVSFTGASANALQAFAEPGAFILQEQWFADNADGLFNDMSVGTGPWRWDGKEPGVNVQTFTKNATYHYENTPYADVLVYQGFDNPLIQKLTMDGHSSEWTWVRNDDQYDTYVANSGIITVTQGSARAAFWAEVEGYFHFPEVEGFTSFEHMWVNPAKLGEGGHAGQTTGWPGG